MSNRKEIVIKDSCILFDLIDLELMSDFFKLELEILTTPQVIDEITDGVQMDIVTKYIGENKLIVEKNGSLESIQSIYDECLGLSYPDSSVLELAIRIGAVVLSSDKSLRNEVVRRNLIVRGVLWIIDELVNLNIISIEQALVKLNLYSQINKRAPISEIQKLIHKYKILQNGN
ncbi:MAG: hypothetical protein KAX69_00470 [Chitinophagales bacterium]|nr:hypothetical protein [Chitinophagales bacterium]